MISWNQIFSVSLAILLVSGSVSFKIAQSFFFVFFYKLKNFFPCLE